MRMAHWLQVYIFAHCLSTRDIIHVFCSLSKSNFYKIRSIPVIYSGKNIQNPKDQGLSSQKIMADQSVANPDTQYNQNHAITVKLFGVTMPFDIITATYAILVAAGGVMGYVKASSTPSLVAGLGFGGLLGTGAYLEASRE